MRAKRSRRQKAERGVPRAYHILGTPHMGYDRSQLGHTKDTIAAALGHGETTVTDIYIDFDQNKVDAANRKVLDWVLYEKK